MPEFLGSSNICSVSAKDVGTFAKHNNNEFCLFLKEKKSFEVSKHPPAYIRPSDLWSFGNRVFSSSEP